MKRRLLELVRCPACGGALALHVIAEGAETVGVPVPAPACTRYCALHDRAIEAVDAAFRPDCQACYGSDVSDGLLSCAACNLLYPIMGGVPRLVRNAFHEYAAFFFAHRDAIGRLEGHKAAAERLGRTDPATFDRRSNESFSLQWSQYQYDDRTWFKDDLALRRGEFLKSLDVNEDRLRGALVLDAGCGNGKLTSAVAVFGVEVVGMDLSRSVERANANRKAIAGDRAVFVHFLQGNVMEPPFAPEVFGYVHSSGVLHHTPNTERAFRSLLPLVRLSGRIYIQLYRRREAWVGVPNRLLRAITSRLPVGLLYRLCYAAVPLHTALVLLVARLRKETSSIRQASWRERAVSLFDNFSPRYQFRYRPEEVRAMFERAGLTRIKDVTLANEARHMVAFVGEKPADPASLSGADAAPNRRGRAA